MSLFNRGISAATFVLVMAANIAAQDRSGYGGNDGLGLGTVGLTSEDAIGIDPIEYLTTWNFNNLPEDQRSRWYQESPLPSGQLLREYWLEAEDRDIEIAPGVWFPAWTYNGQVPGPTIRATEGDRIRVNFINKGTRPHTIHFHGYHPEEMDGSSPSQFVYPGDTFVYEFDAAPFGIHLYHCHATPLTEHIHRGLYGAFIIDPPGGRPPAQELVMMMNGFDTNFDEDNEVYAVNSVAFYYKEKPIQVSLGEKVRIYLVNILEFDETNSFHVHANFFEEFRTGTSLTPDAFTDTVIFGQAERSILEIDFQYPGLYMFHSHKTEFAELGWMGLFDVRE
jgi:FtsP/CotA-like multicopper oxidase with cupredoxin domain